MSVIIPKSQPVKPFDTQVDHTVSFLPKSTFLCLLIAAKGCSKSTTTLNAFMNPQLLAKRFNRVVLISPTASLDDKMQILKEHDIVKVNKPLLRLKYRPTPKKRMVYTVCGQRYVNEPQMKIDFANVPDYMPMDDSDYIEDFSVNTILKIFNEQKTDIDKYGKDMSNSVAIILDDTAGLKQWNDPRIINAVFKCRHVKVSFWVTTQDSAAIPKKVRDNADNLLIFSLGNKDSIYKMSREAACGMDYDDWLQLYYTAVSEPYAFLNVSRVNPHPYKFAQSFMRFLEYTTPEQKAMELLNTI